MCKLTIAKIIIVFELFLIAFGAIGLVCQCASETSQVAHQEFNAKTLLDKYTWFKDVSAGLDQKIANIKVYNSRLKSMKERYSGMKSNEWSRTDSEQYNIWVSEQAGIVASYNNLASEYNSQMSKFNWSFCNIGTLPKGATVPLPREYKPYLESID